MKIVHAESPARAGLVGNPSDGFGGATVSVAVSNWAARVVVYEWPELEILPAEGDRCRFDSLELFLADARANGYDGGMRLVKAAVSRFADFCASRGIELGETFAVRYSSDIPRQVGLAGSSAIVTATLRGLCTYFEVEIADDELPSLALAVETEELGIPAGLQDRVAQVYGGLVFMDFDPAVAGEGGRGRYERLDPSLLPELFIAFRADASERSEVFHSDIRRRYERGDAEVVKVMQQLGELAREARAALVGGDHDELERLMGAGFDLRRSLYELDPRHVRMVELAREMGASATFAGSGGAVVGACREQGMLRRLADAFGREGCVVAPVRVAPSSG
jgi:glucuronokinase